MQSLRRLAAQPSAARAFSTTAARPMSRLTVLGRLAAEPEVTVASTGREYIKYTLITNSGSRENRKTNFWNVNCYVEGPQKEFITGLPKGALCFFEGDISQNTFQDAEGKNQRAMSIVHKNLSVLTRPRPAEVEGGEETE